jgi:hypothetical protein
MPWTPPDKPAQIPRLHEAERRAVAAINLALSVFGRPPVEAVADLFRDREILLATFAELDHYPARQDGRYVGYIGTDMSSATESWSPGDGLKVVAYLRPFMRNLDGVLKELSNMDAQVICALPGAVPEHLAKYGSRMRIVPHAINMSELLAGADAVVSYGGAGLIVQSLLDGVPLLLFPQFTEQAISADRVASISAGLSAPIDCSTSHITENFKGFFHQLTRYRDGATAFHERHRGYRLEGAVEQAVCGVRSAYSSAQGVR